MAFVPRTGGPVDLALGTTGAWTDMDVSGQPGYTPDVVGVELLIVTGTSNRNFGVRKNGSSDTRTGLLLGYPNGVKVGARIGVDSSGIFEAYISDVDVDIYLVGFYTSPGAVFFTNAVDKSQNTTFSWVTTSIASDTGSDTAIGACFEYNVAAALIGVLRPRGSADVRNVYSPGLHQFLITGLNGSEECEQYINHDTVDFLLNGYITSDAVFHTNALDRSTATIGSYVAVTALPAGAVAGIYDLYGVSSVPTRHGLRTAGEGYDYYLGPYLRAHQVVPCDGSGGVEQKIAAGDADLYELGYFTAPAGGGDDLTWLPSQQVAPGQSGGMIASGMAPPVRVA